MERRYMLLPQPKREGHPSDWYSYQVAKAITEVRVSDVGEVAVTCDGMDIHVPMHFDRLRQVLATLIDDDVDDLGGRAGMIVGVVQDLQPQEARLILQGAGVWIIPVIETDEAISFVPRPWVEGVQSLDLRR